MALVAVSLVLALVAVKDLALGASLSAFCLVQEVGWVAGSAFVGSGGDCARTAFVRTKLVQSVEDQDVAVFGREQDQFVVLEEFADDVDVFSVIEGLPNAQVVEPDLIVQIDC